MRPPDCKQYLPKTIDRESITNQCTLGVKMPPVHIPIHEKIETLADAASLWIKYKDCPEQSNIIIEGITIECFQVTSVEAPSSDNYRVVVGIPLDVYEWIFEEVQECFDDGIHEDTKQIISEDNDYIWIDEYLLPEYTGQKETLCQIYKSESGQTEPIGTVKEVHDLLKSDLLGYGQFYIFANDYGDLQYYLTGFQLVNTSPKQSFPKPEIEVSLPGFITMELNKLSRS